MKYIDAELLQKEIERQIMGIIKKQDANPDMPKHRWYLYEGMKEAINDIGDFIDSLQQEQPEVDLDFSTFAKEIDVVFNLPKEVTKNTEQNPLNWEYAIARHFYELGSNTREKK